ncbi:MAG: tyrosine-type recombinase/integrase [Pseudomonadota bacterium]
MPRRYPPYVSAYRDRHGKLRLRFRQGKKQFAIKSKYGNSAFEAEYQALLSGQAPQSAKGPATFETLARRYRRSTGFAGLRESTKQNYRRILDALCEVIGDVPLASMSPGIVEQVVMAKADAPNAANRRLKLLRTLFRQAQIWGLMSAKQENPAMLVDPIKINTDGHYTWTEDDIARFEKVHPEGSQARLAMSIMLHTGVRRSDCIKMGWQHVRNGEITVWQTKTGKAIWIPLHPTLKAELDRLPKTNMTFLLTSFGKPFTGNGFGNKVRAWCDAAGLKHCSAHGLRKACASRLAEAGCTDSEVMAITGHTTRAEVTRYTSKANQKALARSAVVKLANPFGEPKE